MYTFFVLMAGKYSTRIDVYIKTSHLCPPFTQI